MSRPSVRRGLCMNTLAEVLLPITFGRRPDQRFARWIWKNLLQIQDFERKEHESAYDILEQWGGCGP